MTATSERSNKKAKVDEASALVSRAESKRPDREDTHDCCSQATIQATAKKTSRSMTFRINPV